MYEFKGNGCSNLKKNICVYLSLKVIFLSFHSKNKTREKQNVTNHLFIASLLSSIYVIIILNVEYKEIKQHSECLIFKGNYRVLK